jgi:hypothetical protein
MNSYVTVQIETNNSFWWDLQAKQKDRPCVFRVSYQVKGGYKLWYTKTSGGSGGDAWWLCLWHCGTQTERWELIHSLDRDEDALIPSNEDNGPLVDVSLARGRPLHSIFHCCLWLIVDCCVCFPIVILTKPSTSNKSRLHMDQFLSQTWSRWWTRTIRRRDITFWGSCAGSLFPRNKAKEQGGIPLVEDC